MLGRMDDARVVRVSVLVLCVVILVHDIVALAINPDFGIGANAHTIKFLWVDYNGWHVVAGFALFVPGLFVWRRAGLARVYSLAVVLALLITAALGPPRSEPARDPLVPGPTCRRDLPCRCGGGLRCPDVGRRDPWGGQTS